MEFMYKKNKILCIIPARGGSKSIPGKNIKLLLGKPLISYAINAAKLSKYIDRTIVTTDDREIARIAKKYNAEVPFVRPARLATDTTSMLPVLQHAVNYLKNKDRYEPDIIVLIHPTSPFVLAKDIDAGIKKIVSSGASSCATICETRERPEFMFMADMAPLIRTKLRTARRQDLPKVFSLNGAVYITRMKTLMKKNKILDFRDLCGVKIALERSLDIDEPLDFIVAEAIAKKLYQ